MKKLLMITGPTSGLGKEISRIAIKENREILFLGRNIAEKLPASFLSGENKYLEIDFGYPKECISLFSSMDFSSYSNVDLLLNAGTIMPIAQIQEMDFEELSTCLDVNFLSQVALVKSLLANLDLGKTNLRIINVTTGATTRVINGWSCYSISKAAFAMFLNHLELELPEIEIQSFDPGVFESKIQEQIRSSLGHQCAHSLLPGPEKVAQALFKRI
jgi:benzil reductase ((S)-benzoin forming)